MSNYKYLIFDAQYLLTRNFKLKCNYWKETEPYLLSDGTDTGKKFCVPDFTAMDLAKLFFWSVAKFTREVASCDKVILVWDKYPYYKLDYLADFKSDRHYFTEDDLAELDPDKDIDAYINTKYEAECNKIKQKAKYWIIDNFDKLGMKSYIRKGYEGDDWGGIIAQYLKDHDPSSKSAIVSSDSDWEFLTNSNVDRISTGRGKVGPVITTYNDMVIRYGKTLDQYGISLYKLKTYIDSTWGSHNALKSTIKDPSMNLDTALSYLIKEDYSILDNIELYKAQLESFNYSNYPEYDKVIQSLYYLDKGQGILEVDDYIQFCIDNGFGVTSSYYSKFINTLNKDLYND